MQINLEESWKEILKSEFSKGYFKGLIDFIKKEYSETTIYPPGPLIFKALDTNPFDHVKVVILGQDPYHGPGQANGLSFSVSSGVKLPPSLQNIYKELKSDVGITMPNDGDLSRWADQGVLLLNSTLTVRHKSPGSHQAKGWEEFTNAIIKSLNDRRENLVFILWGKYAQSKASFVDKEKHLVIESAHPSPFAAHRGFFGSKPFSRTNRYLKSVGKEEINWN